jgi:hypothetical protein
MGVSNLRIVVAPGWRVIKGGVPWEKRYSRILPVCTSLTETEFQALCGEFWTQLVWAAKKTARGEFRAAQRAVHLHLIENSLRVFQEEALLEGGQAHPFGRRAERWLREDQLSDTGTGTAPDRATLMMVVARLADAFERSSTLVARRKNWSVRGHADVRRWLSEMSKTSTDFG